MIDEQLIVDLRQYLLSKTGILYFSRVKNTPKDLMVSCPFHKGGQERKPSCGIKKQTDNFGSIGTVHCFSCGVTTNIDLMVQQLLGVLYNEDEVETRFKLKSMLAQSVLNTSNIQLFNIPNKSSGTQESVLRNYRMYHPYLQQRGITQDVAKLYDIGFDDYNNQITFPIRDINKNVVGIGRRSITHKKYYYPMGMVKPLYGIYELPRFIRYLWIVEGPFNLWSLRGWNKPGVALLGTGTENQYKQLLNVPCEGYVLALDPDEAGMKGTYKLGEFLLNNHKYNINVSLIPTGKDVNDLQEDEFKNIQVVSYKQWKYINHL